MLKPAALIENLIFQDTEEDFSDDLCNCRLKLDCNENIYGCCENVLNILKNTDKNDLLRYPDDSYIVDKIAHLYSLKPENIIFTNGIDDALNIIIAAYLDKNEELLSLTPCYNPPLKYSKISKAQAKTIEFDDLIFNMEKLNSSIDKNTKIVYLSTPNYQTGELVRPFAAEKMVSINPDILFILDCSYINFAMEVNFKDYTDIVEKYDNIILIKSFSYDYALAGLNIAEVISNENIISNLKKVKPKNSVNILSLNCALSVLKNEKYIETIKNYNFEARNFLTKEIERLGYKIFPSEGNFILCDFKDQLEFYYNKLRKNGIIVKKYPANSTLSSYLRITIPKLSGAKYILELLQKKELLIFDIEGVLFDIRDSYYKAIAETCKQISNKIIEISEIQKIKNTFNLNCAEDIIEYFLNKFSINTDKNSINEIFKNLYLENKDQNDSALINNEKLLISKENIEELSKKYDLIIYTTEKSIDINYYLKKYNLEKFFYIIKLQKDDKKYNLNSLYLKELMSKCAFKNTPRFLSSNIEGIIAANNAEIETVGAALLEENYSYLINNFRHIGVKHILKDIKEIKDILNDFELNIKS